MTQPSPLERLHQRYFMDDQTPPEHVTSHWRDLYSSGRIDVQGGRLVALEGFGFAKSSRRWATRLLNAGMLGINLAVQPNKRTLIAMLPASRRVARRMGLPFDTSVLAQTCALAVIRKHVAPGRPLKILNIGDGRGLLGGLLMEAFPGSLICEVDLGKSLTYQYVGSQNLGTPRD